MNILARIGISTKVLLLLLLLGAVTMVITVCATSSLSSAEQANSAMVAQAKAPPYLARAAKKLIQMDLFAYRVLAAGGDNPKSRKAAADEQAAYETGKSLLDESAAADPTLKAGIAKIAGRFDDLQAMVKPAVALGLATKDQDALAALIKADVMADDASHAVTAFVDATLERDAKTAAELSAAAKSESFWLLVLGVAGIVVSIGVALVVSRVGITGPLARLKAAMQALAAGNNVVVVEGTERGDEVGAMAQVVVVFQETAVAKAAADREKAAADATLTMVVETLGITLQALRDRDLTRRVTADYPGSYGALKTNYNEALDSVRATVEKVSGSAANISTGSQQIAQATEDLARRTESNAASLEETSAALIQMETRLKDTATAAQGTATRADQAMATVGTGRAVAAAAQQAMGRVSGSAKSIDNVIEGLDKIAFQTRVLAMNAAVEAGRAGDAGRGFAVVADLVSALAMRAEEEAKRARDQLSITQSEIVTAVDAVAKVDTALAVISGDVAEVNTLLAGMAADNEAQSSAITQITATVATMDRTTQQNAAMVEETSAAARNLTDEVRTLAGIAAQFQFDRRIRNVPVPVERRASGKASARTPAPPAPNVAAPPPRRAAATTVQLTDGHANAAAADGDWSDF